MLDRDDRVRANGLPWMSGIEIAAFGRLRDGRRKAATVQWESISDNAEIPTLMTISMDQAQVLMDDLWNAGVRPTEGAGSAGAMRAAERHIEDLRAVAFKVLGIQ